MKSTPPPYWHGLLTHYENKGYISNGLTLPYLIGSLQLICNDTNLGSVTDMIESLDDYGCTILKCDTIGEYVIGTLDKETLDNRKLYYTIGNKIIVIDESLNHINNVEELIIFFEDLYNDIIGKNCFSKDGTNWRPFSDDESNKILEFINVVDN